MENLALDRCLEGVERAQTAAHICYSYPMPGVPRPIVDSYPVILEALEHSKIDQLALEFEASKLDPELLGLCPSKTVMFGCIDNGIDEKIRANGDTATSAHLIVSLTVSSISLSIMPSYMPQF